MASCVKPGYGTMRVDSPEPYRGERPRVEGETGERYAFPLSCLPDRKAQEMLFQKTRDTIATTVSQPAKNSMFFSVIAMAISLIALLLGIVAVSH